MTAIPKPDAFTLGFRCLCIAIDSEYGTATFRHEADGPTFTIPLFGVSFNKIATIGIKPGEEFWFDVKRTAVFKKKKVKAKK
jgi:hypothetical protein